MGDAPRRNMMIRRELAPDTLWVITGDDELRHCAETKLRDGTCKVEFIHPDALADRAWFRICKVIPGVILLDVDQDMDRSAAILRSLKRAQIRAPIIAICNEFTKEFGTKIVSEGVSYCLLRGSDCGELQEVVSCLINSRKIEDAEHRQSQAW